MTHPDISFYGEGTELRIGGHPSRRVTIAILDGDDSGKDTLGLAVDANVARQIAAALLNCADHIEGMDT